MFGSLLIPYNTGETTIMKETIFDRFGEAVIDTPEKEAEAQKWAFDAWSNPPDDELAFREMYLKVFDYVFGDTCDPFMTSSLCLTAADLAAGKRHAIVPLQMFDLYLGMLSDEEFNNVMKCMLALIESCAATPVADSHCVHVQQSLTYWLAYSSIVERIPFDVLDKIKGTQIQAAEFDEDDVEYIEAYKELYKLEDDVFMLYAVKAPKDFLAEDAWDEDADAEPDWDYEAFTDSEDDENWDEDDDWAEDFAPSLMDAIKEDERFDR